MYGGNCSFRQMELTIGRLFVGQQLIIVMCRMNREATTLSTNFDGSVGAETTFSGSPFQISGPETLKVRLPTVDKRNIGKTRRLELAEQSARRQCMQICFSMEWFKVYVAGPCSRSGSCRTNVAANIAI